LTLAAEKSGYDVVIESWRCDLARERKCLEEILNRQLDGVVAFLSDHQTHAAFLQKQFSTGTPFVVFGSSDGDALPVDCVISDFRVGLEQAIDLLWAQGHRRYAFLSALAEGQLDGQRTRLFAELMEARAGTGEGRHEMLRCGPEMEDAFGVMKARFSAGDLPTAVVALNDISALASIRAARECGLRVPEDLSVVGVDNVPFGQYLAHALTTIAQPIERMAVTAWDLILSRIESGKELGAPRQVVYPTELVVRESVGACPSR
jgi:LacI family transcriptional regulator